MKYVIDEETAGLVYDSIIETYGNAPADQSRGVVIDAIRAGILDFDDAAGKLTYRLQSPVDGLDKIILSEPDAGQMQRITRGIEVQTDGGKTKIDLSVMESRAIRTLSILGGVAVSIVEKIKRRDYVILREVCHFFE